MFTAADRERIRAEILARAREDRRLTGGAVTGSASVAREDTWSDIDLAFGVERDVRPVLEDWSAHMYATYDVVDHLDVPSGSWIYRVFLLASTLQIDLAFAPARDFGAKAPTFRLAFGKSEDLPHTPLPSANALLGYAWLYALHIRSSLARGRLWQTEYMLSAMRDQVIALACLRHGVSPREGRGVDLLPVDVRDGFRAALVRDITPDELDRAFRAAAALVMTEARHVDTELADRIEPVMREMTETARPSK